MLVALLNLSSWCLMMVKWLFLAVPWGCLQFMIVVFPDHTHLLFFIRALMPETLTLLLVNHKEQTSLRICEVGSAPLLFAI